MKFLKNKMTSPKGMDELFWGKDMEDVFDWTNKLQMDKEVQELDEEKLFKIAKLNLRRKAQDQYHQLDHIPYDQATLQALINHKYGIYDEDELRLKMDAMREEPRQRVQLYYDRLERLFVKG